MLVSQPLAGLWSQSAKPGAQSAMHVPLKQFAQIEPQNPQLFGSLLVSTSQPLATMPSQLAKPGLHVAMAHCPFSHACTALGRSHTLPQAPQSFGLVRRLVSQPLAGLWSQSAKPGSPSQPPGREHTPPTQLAVPLGTLQTTAHPPQLFGSVWLSMLQPVAYWPSQFRNPGLHGPRAQTPWLQKAVPLASVHTLPQVPQLFGSVSTSISQPSAGSPSQSAKPGLHETIVQLPAVQATVSLELGHRSPHPPQLPVSVLPFTSQPSLGSLLQSR